MNTSLKAAFDEAYKQSTSEHAHSPRVSFFEALAARGAVTASLRCDDDPLFVSMLWILSEFEREAHSAAEAKRYWATGGDRRRGPRVPKYLPPGGAAPSAIKTAFRAATKQSDIHDGRSINVRYFAALAQRGALSASLTCGDGNLREKALHAIRQYELERTVEPPCCQAQSAPQEASNGALTLAQASHQADFEFMLHPSMQEATLGVLSEAAGDLTRDWQTSPPATAGNSR